MTQQRRSGVIGTGIFTGIAAGSLLLAGCTAPAEGDSGSQEFSFSYAVSDGTDNPYQLLAEQYMEEFPNVTITLDPLPNDTYGQTIQTQFNAGNAPDVLQTAPGSGQAYSIVPLAEAGFLEALDDTATDLIPNGSESQFQLDGETYGVALSITYAGTVVNDTALDGASFEYPTDFADVLDACEAQVAEGKSLISLAGAAAPNTGIMAMALSATRVFADEPDWNEQRAAGDVTFVDSEGWQQTLEDIVDMAGAGCFQAGAEGAGFDGLIQTLATGNAIMMFAPSGSYVNMEAANPDATFAVGPFPPADAGDGAFGLVSSNYAVSLSAASENKDAAIAFIDWMAEPEQSAAFAELQGSLPVSGIADLDLSDSPYAPVAEVITSGDYVPLPNAAWPNAAVYDALGTGVQGLITGQKSVADVLAAMDAAWDQ